MSYTVLKAWGPLLSGTQPPTLTINGESSYEVTVGGDFSPPPAKAIDSHNVDISQRIFTESDLDTSKAGNYQITYGIYDEAGNYSSKTIDVQVLAQTGNPGDDVSGEVPTVPGLKLGLHTVRPIIRVPMRSVVKQLLITKL